MDDFWTLVLVIFVPYVLGTVISRLVNLRPAPRRICDIHDWAWTEAGPGQVSVLKCKRLSCRKIAGPVDEWNRPIEDKEEP